MSYGIRAVNGSDELVLDDEGYLPAYLGTATFVSTTAQDFNDGGLSTYTIVSSTQIIPVIELSSTTQAAIVSYSQSGSTWTILVTASTVGAALDTRGFANQIVRTVHVYGLPSTPTGWGVALFDGAGVPRADLTRRPFAIARRVTFGTSAGLSSTFAAGIARPGIMGTLRDFYATSTASGIRFDIRTYSSVLSMSGTTQLQRVQDQRLRTLEDAGSASVSILPAAFVLLCELAGLPP